MCESHRHSGAGSEVAVLPRNAGRKDTPALAEATFARLPLGLEDASNSSKPNVSARQTATNPLQDPDEKGNLPVMPKVPQKISRADSSTPPPTPLAQSLSKNRPPLIRRVEDRLPHQTKAANELVASILEKVIKEQGNYTGTQKSQQTRIRDWQNRNLNELRLQIDGQIFRTADLRDGSPRRAAMMLVRDGVQKLLGNDVTLPKFLADG